MVFSLFYYSETLISLRVTVTDVEDTSVTVTDFISHLGDKTAATIPKDHNVVPNPRILLFF